MTGKAFRTVWTRTAVVPLAMTIALGLTPALAAARAPAVGPTAQSAAAATWTPAFAAHGAFVSMTSVDSTGPDDVWVAGTVHGTTRNSVQTAVWHLVDGAVRLTLPTLAPTAFEDYPQGLAAIADDDVWVVSIAAQAGGPTSLVANYDGVTWTPVAVPPTLESALLTHISAAGSDDVWIAGNLERPASLVLLHWDGSTLQREPLPVPPACAPGEYRVVTALQAVGDLLYVGVDCGGYIALQVRRNGHWATVLEVPYPGRTTVRDITVDDAGRVWTLVSGFFVTSSIYTGYAGQRLVLTYDSPPGQPGHDLFGIAAQGRDVVVVGGLNGQPVPLVGRVTTAGLRPDTVLQPDGSEALRDVDIDAGGTGWAVGPAYGYGTSDIAYLMRRSP